MSWHSTDLGDSDAGVHWRASWLVVGIVLIAAYAPMLLIFFQQSWSSPQYQFFPFVIAAFGWLLWSRWREAEPTVGSALPKVSTTVLVLFAWFLLTAATLIYNPWASMVSLILLIGAGCLILASRRQIVYLLGIWLLLWLVLPLPLGFDQHLITKLQLISSHLSSYVLDFAGVCHLMEGNTLLLGDRQLFVDEACSGIVSVRSLIASAVIYGVWRNRPPMHLVCLAAAGALWAMLMNVVRISTIAAALHFWGVDWTAGAPHEILGMVVFAAAFGGLLSTDMVLAVCLAPVESAWQQHSGAPLVYGQTLARWWDRLVCWGDPLRANERSSAPVAPAVVAPTGDVSPRGWFVTTIAFGTLAVLQAAFLGWFYWHPAHATAGVATATALTAESLPSDLDDLRRVSFSAEQRDRDDIFGEYSRTFHYQSAAGNTYLVSCDFPFGQGWHELTICYSGVGWEPTQRNWSKYEDDSGRSWTTVEVDLAKPDGARAFVTWAMFDENGEPVAPPMGVLRDQIWRLLVRRHPLAPTRQMFQVQTFVQSTGEVGEEQKAAARRLLNAACTRLHRAIAADAKAAAATAKAAD